MEQMARTSGRNSAEYRALETACLYIVEVSSENSTRFCSSRTSDLLVRTPTIPSLNPAVVCEFAFRSARAVNSSRTWKNRQIHMSGGTMSSTISASFQLSRNMMMEMVVRMNVPQTKSSNAQPMIRERLEQSEVMRAISHPTAFLS